MLDVKCEARPQRRSPKGSNCGGYDREIIRSPGGDAQWLTAHSRSPVPPALSAFTSRRGYLRDGRDVVGLDNMNAYYDPALKEARRAELAKSNRLPLRQARSRRSRRNSGAVRGAPLSVRRPSRGAGRRAPFARRSATPMSMPISPVSPTSSRDAATMAAGICSMHRRRRSTAPTRRCRSRCTTTSIIRSASTAHRRRRMS